jgi:hypothetical protein
MLVRSVVAGFVMRDQLACPVDISSKKLFYEVIKLTKIDQG